MPLKELCVERTAKKKMEIDSGCAYQELDSATKFVSSTVQESPSVRSVPSTGILPVRRDLRLARDAYERGDFEASR